MVRLSNGLSFSSFSDFVPHEVHRFLFEMLHNRAAFLIDSLGDSKVLVEPSIAKGVAKSSFST